MKRCGATKGRINYAKANDDKVVISYEYYENDRPTYICSICNQTLIRLTDAGQNNRTFWCRNCSVEYDPESENLRKETKITVPDRNVEPCITSVDITPDVSIRHEPELRGGFAQLARKGTIRITSYSTTEKE
jgi:DNA-directed RNA polymerase subunit RPC12/RpoP